MSNSDEEGLMVEEEIEGKRVRTLTEKGKNYHTARKKTDYARQLTGLKGVLATVRSELSKDPLNEEILQALKEDISIRLKDISTVVNDILELDPQQNLTAALTELTTSSHKAISDIVSHTKRRTDERIEQLSRSTASKRNGTVYSTTSKASSARRCAAANVAAMKVKLEEGLKEDEMKLRMLELETRTKLLKAKKEEEESLLKEERQEEERQLKLRAKEAERRVRQKGLQAEIELDREKEKLKRQLEYTQQLTNLKAEEARVNALDSGSESSSRRSLSFLPTHTATASASFDQHSSGLAASSKVKHSDSTTKLLDLINQDVSSVRAVIGEELKQFSDVLISKGRPDASLAAPIGSAQSQVISTGVTMSSNQTVLDFGHPWLSIDSNRNQVTTAGVTVTSKAMQDSGSPIYAGDNPRKMGNPMISVHSSLRPTASSFSPNDPDVTYSFVPLTQNSSHQENKYGPTSLSNAQSAYQNSFVSKSAYPYLYENRAELDTPRSESPVETLSKGLNAAIALSRLPPPEPSVFSGDHLLYPTWKASFSLLIESRGISPQEKMLYLQKYVGGAAREAIAGFFLLRDESAYLNALVALEKRFGNSYAVSQAFRTKLDKWPAIKSKDASGLRSFSDFLQQCLIASQEVGGLAILDDIHQIKKLVDKLPDWFSHRWNRYVAATKRDKQRYPLFREFTNFINDEAEIVSDPVFGTSSFANSLEAHTENAKSQHTSKPRVTMSVCARCSKEDMSSSAEIEDDPQTGNSYQSNQEPSTCSFCKRLNHDISKCRDFMKKPWDERRDFIMKQGLCFGCLRSSEHRVKDCKERLTCTKCQKKHATCLHDDNFRFGRGTHFSKNDNHRDSSGAHTTSGSQQAMEGLENEAGQPSQNASLSNFTSYRIHADKRKPMTSMILPVYVSSASNPKKEMMVYALLDTMSDTTFVVNSVVEELEAPFQTVNLVLTTMTDDRAPISCKRVPNLRIRGISSNESIKLPSAYTREDISINDANIPTKETVLQYPHLKHLHQVMPTKQDCPVGLLIGYNCPAALMPKQVVQSEADQPFAIETRLGWSVIGGRCEHDSFDSFGISHHVILKEVYNQKEVETVAHVYRTRVKEATANDFLEIMERDLIDTDVKMISQDDMKFREILEKNVHVNDEGHYEMPLPFKNEEPNLPQNRHVAMKRLMGLKKQFMKRPTYHEHYVTFMDEILHRKDAEKVPSSEVEKNASWYIPHHGVYHPKKPGKVRVVFDCSARHSGTCLNEHLLQGPDLNNPLVGVLCRFRKGQIAFSCDVEKMFHQFHVNPEHRDYLRFLWWEDGDYTKSPVDYRMRVHLFGATSSPGCAIFGLRKLASDNHGICEEAAEFLKHDFYVDDGLQSKDSVDDAVRTLSKAREICDKGGLRLHKIVSNSPEVLEHFPETEISTQPCDLLNQRESNNAPERVLGIQWCLQDDTLQFKPDIKKNPLTRRGILSTIASIYDPLGLISPVVLKGRQLLQEMCRDKLGWDDSVPDSLLVRWNAWLSDLENFNLVQVPRCYFKKDFGTITKVELHHFSDASTNGYGQCSYLRLTNSLNDVTCALVMAKSRVAPLKTTTIPRLELQAATLSVKTAKFLEDEIRYSEVSHHFWTDSKIVLGYIQNESKRFHVFVANRIQQIRKFSSPQQWSHVSSEENPADLASRGINVHEIMSPMWQSGPSFLSQRDFLQETDVFEVFDDDKEVKTCMSVQTEVSRFTSFENRVKRFSGLSSLLTAVSVIVRASLEKKGKSVSKIESMEIAQRNLIKCIQRETLECPSSKLKNVLKGLDSFCDSDGLLRVGGRISRSSESYERRHPSILVKESHLSTLIVRDSHEKIAHQGRMSTINKIRTNGFWIIGLRRAVSSLIHNCVRCMKLRGTSLGQKMSDLPKERIEPSAPFLYCGLDCFGPFVVKDGRKQVKRYGLIFTCLASRAIHIEALDDLSTDSFISGLRCLIALRGVVRLVRCDRGTNFVGADNELKRAMKELDSKSITAKMLSAQCEFQFNPPSSSHMGGVWERQIRTVRNVLSGLLLQSSTSLNTSSFRTLLYEVMAIVNSRPLSTENLESSDCPLPLTPNHILTLKSDPILAPPGTFLSEDLYTSKRWRRVQLLADQFWKRWRKEYVATLQPRRVWSRQQRNVSVGDVVLLQDENASRADWKLGRVRDVYPSADGLVRSVQVSLAAFDLDQRGRIQSRRVVLTRPVNKMIVLLKSDSFWFLYSMDKDKCTMCFERPMPSNR